MSYNRGLAQCARIARKLVETHAMAIMAPSHANGGGDATMTIDGKPFATEEAFNEALRPIVNKTVRKLRVETLGVIMCAARKDTLSGAFAEENGRALLRQTAITLIIEHVMTNIQRDYLEVLKLLEEASDELADDEIAEAVETVNARWPRDASDNT